jgi:hypothetical protein
MTQIVWGNDAADGPIITVNETLGTSVFRNALHSWFHTGEVNMLRQLLGHPEVVFIPFMAGNMEWQPVDAPLPAWVEYSPEKHPAFVNLQPA